MSRTIRHEDGTYFNLSESSYYADDALGSSDLKRLTISGADYWYYSLLNPERPDDETRARRNGTALHCCVLFGSDEFHRRYICEVSKADYPEALVTVDDIKRELRANGGTVSGSKGELTARLRSFGDYTFWDDLVSEQEASGKIVLKREDYSRIVIASEMIKRNPELESCFENGVPEVSVFWTVDGVRFRARFDYLRMFAVIDLKSFTNVMDKPIDLAINSAIFNHRYDVQSHHYLNARERMREHIRAGRVFGDIDRDWLNKLAAVDDYLFTFVFYTVNGAPIARAVDVPPGGMVDGAAGADVARAIETYKKYRAHYGDGLWVDLTPRRTLGDEDVPGWMRVSP
jgi:hypothetical protein